MSQSNVSKVISTLRKISTVIRDPSASAAIVIGSTAASRVLKEIRTDSVSLAVDIICSATFLIKWLQNKKLTSYNTIEITIPTCNDKSLDILFVTYGGTNERKYNFFVPRSSISFAAYLLNNIKMWSCELSIYRNTVPRYASEKLLLILKKYMLYYSCQWQKTARDYRLLITITSPITDQEKVFCNLFIQYNEKLHGRRQSDTDQEYSKDEFFSQTKSEQLAYVYRIAKQLSSSNGDILVGFEHICTKSPLWLADFLLDHWIDIQNEEFKEIIRLPYSSNIEYNIENYRLFEELPELVMQNILFYITDPLDFHSMKLVCKRWYTILNQESFWQNLYRLRYNSSSEHRDNWKMTYFMKLTYKDVNNQVRFDELVDATRYLRQTTVHDVIRLSEHLSQQNQSVDLNILLDIDYILSHSYYANLKEVNNRYSARIVLIGFYHRQSKLIADVELIADEHGTAHDISRTEFMSVDIHENSRRIARLSLGYDLVHDSVMETQMCCKRNIGRSNLATNLSDSPSMICSRFSRSFVSCLFAMMIHPAHRTRFINYLKKNNSLLSN